MAVGAVGAVGAGEAYRPAVGRVVTRNVGGPAAGPGRSLAGAAPTGRRLLLVFAHPDDEAFFTAGTVARHVAAGGEAALVTATRGEMGSQPVPPVCAKEKLGQVRSAELRAACRAMSVGRLTFLGYLDGSLAQADPAEATGRVERALRRYRPDAIVTFGPDGIYGHPDHVAIHRLTVAAYERVYGRGALHGLWYVAAPSAFWRYRPNDWVAATRLGPAEAGPGREERRRPLVEGEPEAAIDIGPWIGAKLEALLAHRSQRHNVERTFGGLCDLAARVPKDDEARAILSREFFTLARGPRPEYLLEGSLFEG